MLAAAVAVAGLAAACTSAERQVDVDGGTTDVVVLGEVVVSARPGQKIVLRHAGKASVHAFVGPSNGDPPPLFAPQAGGLVPNPKVWGPVGSGSWDGRAYRSTGAMHPSELREIRLADDIDEGEYSLMCALHRGLVVVFRIGGEPTQSYRPARPTHPRVRTEPKSAHITVTAGFLADDAYVAGFTPTAVRIPVGGSITWRAGTSTPVDVVFGPRPSLARTVPPDGLPAGNADGWEGHGMLRSGFLSADPTAGAVEREWTVTFTKPGTYRYASRFGEAMTGTVVVEP